MVILGIDPGSRATGLGLVELEGSRLRYLESEVIRPPRGAPSERLAHIHTAIRQRLERWEPGTVALEGVFAARNPRSALLLGQARGAALSACGLAGIECAEYAPAQVKAAVAGFGGASKEQVQAMVQRLLGLVAPPARDAADALAVAICHGHRGSSRAAERVASALAAEEPGEDGAYRARVNLHRAPTRTRPHPRESGS